MYLRYFWSNPGKMPFLVILSTGSCTCLSLLPLVTSTPSSMLIVKTYGVIPVPQPKITR
jgi:hypothetical protein